MTVLEVIQRSTEFLTRKGVESPRLQVELLLAHVLKLKRLQLYLNFERVLTETEANTLRDLVQRRGNRQPLQHLVGSTSFCGYEMKVTSDVLVPRPETEQLAELAWQHLQGLKETTPRVLDFGTGSGCLPITLAVKCPPAEVHALDISPAALAIARENAQANKVAERIQFHQGDGFAALPAGLRFHLIVSNPPYIPSAEIGSLEPEVRDHDPRLALDGGEDGLNFYRRLAVEAVEWLYPGGCLMVEFGDGQAEQIAALFVQPQWQVAGVRSDLSGRARILIARSGRS